MKDQVKRWLADQLAGIESVRGCSIHRAADIVAITWGAAQIHVYLLDALPRPRALRKLVQDNSRVGVGTLLLVDAALVPADGARVAPDEALIALHALHGDKFYTWRQSADGPHVGQVHLRDFGHGDEREVWYGPDVEISHLPCYRVWVKHPNAVKGDWLIASFGSEAFWKKAGYTATRDAVRRQRRTGGTQTFNWSRTAFGDTRMDEEPATGQTETAPRPAPNVRLERSYEALGLKDGATSEEVKAAFRRMARELHPDVSTLPKAEAELRFKTVSEAYAFIRLARGW